jgi:chromosome segregation protein
LSNEITSLETRIQGAASSFQRCTEQIAKLAGLQDDVVNQLDRLSGEDKSVSSELQRCDDELRAAKARLAELQKELAEDQKQMAQYREAFTGASERAMVLQELERQLEGLSSGVKQLLVAARESPTGPLREIHGLVADILEVRVDMAPLIETALGEKAGYLVIGPGQDLREMLQKESYSFGGRVGFVPTQVPRGSRIRPSRIDLSGRPGVVGCAASFVRTRPRYEDLIERLLGSTWIVETLAHAMALSEAAPGQSFVTRSGQWLAADGTLCVGPKKSATGLISRRSELRDVEQKIADLTVKIDQYAGRIERASESVADAHANVESLSEQRDALQKKASDCHRRISAVEERQSQLDEKRSALDTELGLARRDRDAAESDLTLLRDRRLKVSEQLGALEQQLHQDQQRLGQVELQQQQQAAELTTAKVQLATSEQQLDGLTLQMQQYQQDHQERQRAVQESRTQLAGAGQRATRAERRILQLEAEVASLYLEKEDLLRQSTALVENGDQHRQQRSTALVEVQKIRSSIRKLEGQIHELDLAAGKLHHERESLATRMREDYDIELADLQHEPTEEEQHEREVIEEEIADLRRKLGNIGNVNMDALEELDQLETRFNELSTQYDDLTQAKNSLEHIIDKINADSRRLFTETLETVRGHFQSLFRKLFGGGQADIVIDEDEDILESGLEIVARPPGKEPRNISLLSGGEKTLTCVALLLAIFRSRPSPFCVLDEVDAALDEANIERFIGVLREFLQWTQFIVVTHSKKTMTCAGTLYGVTMQESGISKRVSVRFEDVSETGEILRTRDDETDSPLGDADEPRAA